MLDKNSIEEKIQELVTCLIVLVTKSVGAFQLAELEISNLHERTTYLMLNSKENISATTYQV